MPKLNKIDIRKYLSEKDSKIGDEFAKNMDELFLKTVKECTEWIYPSIRLIIFTENIIESIYNAFVESESKSPTEYGINVMQQLNETLNQLNIFRGYLLKWMDNVMQEEEKIEVWPEIMEEEENEI